MTTRLAPQNKRLTGLQFRDFRNALIDAYGTPPALDQMLRFFLEKRLSNLSLANDMPTIAFDVISKAEDEAWSLELLVAARTANPNNPELLAFAQQFGLGTEVYEQAGGTPASQEPITKLRLERFVVEANGLKDVVQWRETLATLEGQVCRVEIPKGHQSEYGTGFLLGSAAVITNYHVMRLVDRGLVRPQDVILRFDYKRRSDGLTVNEGTVYHLASDWLIHESPISKNDDKGEEPASGELDFALLRVEGAPGNDPAGGPEVLNKNPDAAPRGWIKVPAVPPELAPDSSLFILQHPKGDPLKLAIDTNAIIEVKYEGRRVRYRTNTDEGSSGSPCFDANWNLAALHHMGDPAYGPAQFNQGIPMHAIVQFLKDEGKDGEIGQ